MKRFIPIILICAFQYAANCQAVNDIEAIVTAKMDSSQTYLYEHDRPEVALRLAFESLEYDDLLKEKGADGLRRRIRYFIIESLSWLKAYKLAIPYLIDYLEVERETVGNDSPMYISQTGTLATFYLRLDQLERADSTFREELKAAQRNGTALRLASAMNNLGIFHEQIGQADSAMHYYDAANKLLPFKNKRDTGLHISIRDNQASILKKQGRSLQALDSMRVNFAICKQLINYNQRTFDKGLKLAKELIDLGYGKESRSVLEQLPEYLNSNNSRWVFDQLVELERTWVNYAILTEDPTLQLLHFAKLDSTRSIQLERAQRHRSSVERILADMSIDQVKRDLKTRTEKLKFAKNEARLNKYLLFIVGIFSAFIILSMFLFYKRKVSFESVQRELKEEQLKNQELKNKELKQDLDHKEKDFSNVMMQVALKDDWATDTSNKLMSVIDGKSTIEASEIKKLIRELKQQSGIHEKIDMYQSGIEDVNSRFFAALEERFPDLTKVEREICGLIRLNLDGKEIATIRNIHPSSVRKMRQRIRKKFSLEPQEDLYEFIQAV